MTTTSTSRRTVLLVSLLILAGAVLPVLIYWTWIGHVPTVMAGKAHQLEHFEQKKYVLVDIRKPGAAVALPEAVAFEASKIDTLTSRYNLPDRLYGKALLLICDSGVASAQATLKLRCLGVEAYNVRGGVQEWIAADAGGQLGCVRHAGDPIRLTPSLPFREAPWYEQWAAVATGYGVKPVYMLLSLVAAGVLWRRREADLAALRRGMIFFFLGEGFCAINWAVFRDQSYLSEFLHGYGMVLTFCFVTFALLEGMDRRLIHFSGEGRCAAAELCSPCGKHSAGPCGLKRLFYLGIPATMILAAMPLTFEPTTHSYNTQIVGTYYNYSHPLVHQVYEFRFCPLAAIALLAASLAALLASRGHAIHASKLLFSAGVGLAGFGLMRTVLYAAYHDNQVWFAVWEEIQEMLFILAVVVTLWVFRGRLFRPAENLAAHEEA